MIACCWPTCGLGASGQAAWCGAGERPTAARSIAAVGQLRWVGRDR